MIFSTIIVAVSNQMTVGAFFQFYFINFQHATVGTTDVCLLCRICAAHYFVLLRLIVAISQEQPATILSTCYTVK
jgi:hypothetical protein